jgi:hypothetical protein
MQKQTVIICPENHAGQTMGRFAAEGGPERRTVRTGRTANRELLAFSCTIPHVAGCAQSLLNWITFATARLPSDPEASAAPAAWRWRDGGCCWFSVRSILRSSMTRVRARSVALPTTTSTPVLRRLAAAARSRMPRAVGLRGQVVHSVGRASARSCVPILWKAKVGRPRRRPKRAEVSRAR